MRRVRSAGMPSPVAEQPPDRGGARRWIHGALFDNVGIKFLSLVLAVTVFLLVNTDKEREIRVRAGLDYRFPADKVLVSDELHEVTLTVKGPWRRLRNFDERELSRILLDLSAAPTGDVAITTDMVQLPPGLTVTSITPRAVRVEFDRRVEKEVEVTAVTAGGPEHGYFVAEQKVVPALVKVRGGERRLGALTSIRTHEVSVQNRTAPFDTQIDLAPPAGVETEPGQRVTVHVRIEEELVTKQVTGLPIAVRGEGIDPAKWTTDPARAAVSLTGARLAVEQAQAGVAPWVKWTPDARGREADVMLDGVPAGVGARITPERVKVVPAKAPPPE